MSEEHWTCPTCNSDHAVSTDQHFEGELVIHCPDCDSWFGAETNRPVLFVEDGGDDVPDDAPNRLDPSGGIKPEDLPDF